MSCLKRSINIDVKIFICIQVHQFTKIQIHCQFSDQSINLKKNHLCDIQKELGREENQTFFLSILLYGSD